MSYIRHKALTSSYLFQNEIHELIPFMFYIEVSEGILDVRDPTSLMFDENTVILEEILLQDSCLAELNNIY